MTVTSVVPLDKRRSKVFLDEDFALVLYKGEVNKYGLSEGCELEEAVYREIINTVLNKRARERAMYLLKNSAKTENEIREKLQEGGYPREVIDHTVVFLKEYRYIDDENYARHYIERQRTRKSERQICYALQQKGLTKETVSMLMEKYPVEEEEQICRYLKKKQFGKEDMTPQEKSRIAASLGRKGFSFDVIKKMMSENFDNRA